MTAQVLLKLSAKLAGEEDPIHSEADDSPVVLLQPGYNSDNTGGAILNPPDTNGISMIAAAVPQKLDMKENMPLISSFLPKPQ